MKLSTIFICLLTCSSWLIGPVCRAAGKGPAEPQRVPDPAGDGFLVSMPEGWTDMIYARAAPGGAEIVRRRSRDNGRSWSGPETLYRMGARNLGTPLPLATRDGALHLFWQVERRKGNGNRPAVDYFIDIWHARSLGTLTRWTEPKPIFEGYVGSLNGVAELASGRIVLPFAYWLAGVPEGPPAGCNVTTTIHSDDAGGTWQRSPAKLTAPCFEGYNGDNYGAIEPTILQLRDGRVWLLIRTQTGLLYESFSPDGSSWSRANPSRFVSSDSPAGLARLADGRIMIFWNNCENTSRINGAGVYTNRDTLHTAISADEGKTWHGYREVYCDPLRNESPPKTGDRGTAYPFATPTPDGQVLLVTGQGPRRRVLLRVDPAWLEATHHADDFSRGLDGWSVFKSFGPAVGWWRDRVQGPQLVAHPSRASARVLRLCRPDDRDGDGAVWNFPLGHRGRVDVKLRLGPGAGGASIALADRFIQPTDDAGEKRLIARLDIAGDGRVLRGARLEPGRWYLVSLHWDLDQRHCRVLVDGAHAGTLALANASTPGVCYLRLRSRAAAKDSAGFLVESVRADVLK